MVAIAIPDFLKFCARAKQSEARQYLGQLYTLQMKYHAEHGTFASHTADQECFQLLYWQPDHSRYAYYCDTAAIKSELASLQPTTRPPIIPVTKDHFVIIAVANPDSDPDLDYWTIMETNNLQNQLKLPDGSLVGGSDL